MILCGEISEMRYFFAISTGHNIANIAPLLAVASPSDTIVFISSAEATNRNWTKGAFDVLRKHRITSLKEISLDSDSPEALYASLRSVEVPKGSQVIIVGNGGTKLQSFALIQALHEYSPQILYSLDHPCQLQWYSYDFNIAPRLEAYGNTKLDLDDVLQLRGMYAIDKGELLYWQDGLTDAGNGYLIPQKGYGFEQGPTFDLYDQYSKCMARRLETQAPLKLPRWQDLLQLHPKLADTFKRTVASCKRLPPDRLQYNDPSIESLFNAAMNVLEKSSKACSETKVEPLPPIGKEFEKVLASRICRFLTTATFTKRIIQAVYLNVKVGDLNRPGIMKLEADILLILKNGVTVAIEAKSHTADTKDLDARLQNLQRALSQLAKIVICSPLFTVAVEKLWFEAHHNFVQKVVAHGMTHLPYTLPDQPNEYLWPLNSVTNNGQRYSVKPFEEGLISLLRPYC